MLMNFLGSVILVKLNLHFFVFVVHFHSDTEGKPSSGWKLRSLGQLHVQTLLPSLNPISHESVPQAASLSISPAILHWLQSESLLDHGLIPQLQGELHPSSMQGSLTDAEALDWWSSGLRSLYRGLRSPQGHSRTEREGGDARQRNMGNTVL